VEYLGVDDRIMFKMYVREIRWTGFYWKRKESSDWLL
jgi:hypothetical protein